MCLCQGKAASGSVTFLIFMANGDMKGAIMKLRDLEYVSAIDRYRNFGRAAKACHVSQPALSAQVKKLEDWLGIEIFARDNQRVTPTEAGVRIVETAREMLRSARQIKDYAAEYRDPLSVPLKVGIFPTLAPFVIPYISSRVRDLTDQLQLIYRERPTHALLAELDDRLIDIAMVSGPIEHKAVNFTPVFQEPLMLAVPDTHRLANHMIIEADDIPCEEMILLDQEHCLRRQAISLCDDENVGIDVPEDVSATSLLTVTHFLTHGMGCTLIPALGVPFLSQANPTIRMIAINDPSYSRTIGFLSRKGCPREHILLALCDAMRKSPPKGVRPIE